MGVEARASVTSTGGRAWDCSLDPCGNFIPASSSLPDKRLEFVATGLRHAFEGSFDTNVGCPYERELTILLGQKHESGIAQSDAGAWSGRWHNVC